MAKGGMTDRTLLGLIAQHEQAAMGGTSAATNLATAGTTTNYGTLDVERATALDYYHGRPIGNEQPDRSQVVSQDVRDVVEWIKPQILRMFVDADEMVRFDPENPNDEQQAEQESDVVNYIFMRQNDGVLLLHDALTDALILKNGYIKVWYETETREETETYTGLDESTLTMVVQSIEAEGDKAEIAAKREVQGIITLPTGQQVPNVTYDVQIRRMHKEGMCKCMCVATEDMLVSPNTRGDLQQSPFVAQRLRNTRSHWKELGYTGELEASSNDPRIDIQSIARSDTTDELGSDSAGSDRSMEEMEALECYMRVDYDGDGEAELRKILRVGNEIVENETVAEIPFAYAVPIRMPHRHIGISLYDLTKDIQDIKTTLLRQGLDNTYLINNGRFVVNSDNVNVEDMLVTRPGGIVRTKGVPQQDVMPLATPAIGQMIMPVIDYCDNVIAQRTGISATTQGLDPDTLQGATANAYNNAMNAATAKVELMARMFAELVKGVALLIHGCIVRHQDKPMVLKLRNQWVEIDPTQWKHRYSVRVNVGLGTGSRDQMQKNLMLIGQMQQAAAQAGIVLPPNVYNLVTDTAKMLGYQTPGRYFTDPNSPQFQQMQAQKAQQGSPDPRLQAAKINAQANVQRAQINAQATLQDTAMQHNMKQQELLQKAQIEREKMAQDAIKAERGNSAQLAGQMNLARIKHASDMMQIQAQTEADLQKQEQAFLKNLQGASNG